MQFIAVNCQSYISKQGAFKNLVECSKPDIIVATVTWLDSSVANTELELHNFTIFRTDRPKGKHGEEMIAVIESIQSTVISFKNTEISDIMWAQIKCQQHMDILIGACYRPDIADQTTLPDIWESLESMTAERKRPIRVILAGDFNLPGLT